MIVLLPMSLDPTALWDALRVEVERIRGVWPTDLDITKLSSRVGVVEAFAGAFGLDDGRAVTLESVLCAPDLPDVIGLRGIERLEPSLRSAWLRFMV